MKKVSDEDFVVAYVTGGSMTGVVSALGMTPQGIRCRAKRLRKAGVLLPELKDMRGKYERGTDIQGLNELIKKHLKLRKKI